MDHCLSPQILMDTNINVQIRNSWTISFICNLYPIEDIISCKLLSQDGAKISNFEILIQICLKYAQLTASNKEKVASSSIRALGFIVQNLIIYEDKIKKG